MSLMTICFSQVAFPQAGREPSNATSLAQLSASLQDISRKVEPSVVQIFNSSYAVECGGETMVQQWRSSGRGY
jgi:hypothetical protein